ncbi:hypothetical protein RRG08_015686 [Elysia crispata]|uniref:Uncharacterized protein n=1 Tax=Elysia crispata TaxID=231223 RepID=A0AAE0Y2J4_9GAST|nr:hypothetical protein RRG08_015686 [Elysia crispata]
MTAFIDASGVSCDMKPSSIQPKASRSLTLPPIQSGLCPFTSAYKTIAPVTRGRPRGSSIDRNFDTYDLTLSPVT